MNDARVELVSWSATPALRDIRQRVFVDEQHVPPSLEWDEHDLSAVHFQLLVNEQPAGTARLLRDGHIGRVAILPDYRGLGLGNLLMREVMRHAQELGHRHLELSAQTHAQRFYERLGFIRCSEPYMDAGIAHIDMHWSADTQNQAELPPIEFVSPGSFSIHNPEQQAKRYSTHLPYQLGEQRDLIEIDEEHALAHACHLVLQARRRLTISSPEQAMWLFHRRDFIDCCEQFIATHPKGSIRVLVNQVTADFTQGHSLSSLQHRFPSLCEIRKRHPDLAREPQVYLLADDSGILMFPQALQPQGFVRYHSPDQVRRWQASFDEHWSSSLSDQGLRRFTL